MFNNPPSSNFIQPAIRIYDKKMLYLMGIEIGAVQIINNSIFASISAFF